MVAPRPLDEPAAGERGWRRLARRHASWAIARSAIAAAAIGRFQLRHDFSHEMDIALGDPSRGPLGATRYSLPRIFDASAPERRRRNFRYLKEALSDLFSRAFDVDLHESSPFAFPIEIPVKDEVERELIRHGIGPERFWAFPHPALNGSRFLHAARLRERLLALPVHQELRPADLERIAETTRRAVASAGRA